MTKRFQPHPCPCGNGIYAQCCGVFHTGQKIPPTAEALMRSRYAAYALGLEDYVRNTWHPTTLPADFSLTDNPRWIGLAVRPTPTPPPLLQKTTPSATAGPERADNRSSDLQPIDFVHFVARYRVGGRAQRLEEISRFVFVQDRWWYLDGEHPNA